MQHNLNINYKKNKNIDNVRMQWKHISKWLNSHLCEDAMEFVWRIWILVTVYPRLKYNVMLHYVLMPLQLWRHCHCVSFSCRYSENNSFKFSALALTWYNPTVKRKRIYLVMMSSAVAHPIPAIINFSWPFPAILDMTRCKPTKSAKSTVHFNNSCQVWDKFVITVNWVFLVLIHI